MTGKQKKVLIIDDGQDVTALLGARLRKNNYCVVISADGGSGLAAAIKEKPDIIFCDIMLPDINGLELAGRLKENKATAGIPVVMLSASSPEETGEKARQAGAAGFLEKPFNFDEALKLLGRILGPGESAGGSFRDNEQDRILWESIRKGFISGLKEKICAIEQSLARLPDGYKTIFSLAHKIRGSAATVGYPEIGQKASLIMKYAAEDRGLVKAEAAEALASLVAEMRGLCEKIIKEDKEQ